MKDVKQALKGHIKDGYVVELLHFKNSDIQLKEWDFYIIIIIIIILVIHHFTLFVLYLHFIF